MAYAIWAESLEIIACYSWSKSIIVIIVIRLSGKLVLVVGEGAKVFVNGEYITGKLELMHSDRYPSVTIYTLYNVYCIVYTV